VDIDTVVVDRVVDLFVADQHLEDKGRDFERQMDMEIVLVTCLPVYMYNNEQILLKCPDNLSLLWTVI
jgi:hypothetical protein